MKYTKPPKTLEEQIALLRSRGLVIEDETAARRCLMHVNYYRLTGYWLMFEESHDPHRFRPGTRFEDILNHYTFDREFRLLLLDAIERIEVSVRTQWAHQFALHGGSHAHLNPQYASRADNHAGYLNEIREAVAYSQEPFVVHLRKKYTEPETPPIWAVSELLSLGQLSRWYKLTSDECRGPRTQLGQASVLGAATALPRHHTDGLPP